MLATIQKSKFWKLCRFLKLKSRTIYTEDSPYLTRFYLLHKWRHILPGVFIHYFWRGDGDRDLHNHPWKWSFSIILENGYVEERRKGTHIIMRRFKPGSINIIRANDFHRVDLLDGKGTWSLFIAGPRAQSWGFWDRDKDEFYDHTEFFARREALQT